jgi:HSP20 family molecular chaperone IbpA
MNEDYLRSLEEIFNMKFTSCTVSTEIWTFEELDESFELKVPMVGVTNEQLQVKVKSGVLYINNEENVFTPDVNLVLGLPVEVYPDTMEVILRDGILKIIIDKPDNYEFDLTVGE